MIMIASSVSKIILLIAQLPLPMRFCLQFLVTVIRDLRLVQLWNLVHAVTICLSVDGYNEVLDASVVWYCRILAALHCYVVVK